MEIEEFSDDGQDSHLSPDRLRKAVKSLETAIQSKQGADVVQLRMSLDMAAH